MAFPHCRFPPHCQDAGMGPHASLLIVDDDAEFSRMLTDTLADEGFACERVAGGGEALALLKQRSFDLVILDMMMPAMSGLDVMRRLRPQSDMPVLILTARGDDVDRIVGLELGADDYLPKPFHPRELVARIRAILRRTNRSQTGHAISAGSLVLDSRNLSVTIDGRPARLTVAEFLVLECLVRSVGQMLTREALSEKALGRPLEEYDRSINTHVSNLRRKLGLEAQRGVEIRSVRNLGYMLVVESGK